MHDVLDAHLGARISEIKAKLARGEFPEKVRARMMAFAAEDCALFFQLLEGINPDESGGADE